MSAAARDAVLGKIRSALQAGADDPHRRADEWVRLPRNYHQAPQLAMEAQLDLLEDRLRDYDAEVTRVQEVEVAQLIRSIVVARGSRPTLLAAGFPEAWTPKDVALSSDDELSAPQLDTFDGVISGAMAAVAETGTLILQSVPGQGRRALTLVPDFHLCVVRAADVVENVPQAFARLEATNLLPTTFVSGPSATADIEMTRIKGVHGPRFLHVLLVT